MVYFKSLKQGFTLIETVLALAIFGMLFSSVLIIQQSSFATLLRSSGKLTRMYLLKNFLVEIGKAKIEDKPAPTKQDIKKPPTQLEYEERKPAKASALSSFEDIVIQKVTATWQAGVRKLSLNLILVRYKPEKEKKE